MTGKLTASLRQAPVTVPALAMIGLLVVWATDQAGYPVTHWAPGGLIVLALLAIAVATVRRPLAAVAAPVRLALACLAAYTALSYLSIVWASAPGEALEGADRTLLYLLVFALMACWPQRAGTAAALLLVWVLSISGLALYVVLHLHAAAPGALPALLPGGRLTYPSGYANANAAEWLMACWPALLLARERRLWWGLRGLLAGAAVLLAEVALLSQSRGSLYSTPIVAILVLALLPGRTRTFALLVPVGAAVALAARPVLRVGDHLRDGVVVAGTLHHALAATLLAALGAGAVVALGAAVESRRRLSEGGGRRVHRAVGAVGVAAAVAAVAVGLAAAGNPVSRVEREWRSFKGGYTTEGGGDRLLSGLGSNRYDFYRVALDEFLAHPILGIGVDNFQQQYLVHGRSEETPRYPHSLELRTLSQTGLVGMLIALVGLGAALLAVAQAIRAPDRLAAGVAAAALAGFGYWVVHGSVDWFWEFAGLGAPAFALLGLGCALAPAAKRSPAGERSAADEPVREGARSRGVGRRWWPPALGAGVAVIGAALAALALAGPWLSQLESEDAARVYARDPGGAYSKLSRAAGLDPLSDQPYVLAGSIAVRRGELDRADREFASALKRVPNDSYATLERGAIASNQGRGGEALRLLRRAVALAPRDALAREALQIARRGRRVSVQALDLAILREADELA